MGIPARAVKDFAHVGRAAVGLHFQYRDKINVLPFALRLSARLAAASKSAFWLDGGPQRTSASSRPS